MRVILLSALFISMFASATAYSKSAPLVLKPSGPWVVEFADNKCLLGRAFGIKKEMMLVFEPQIVGNDFLVMIVRADRRQRTFDSGVAAVITPGKSSVGDLRYAAYSSQVRRMIRTALDGDVLTLSDLNSTIEVDAKGEGRFVFQIPGIAKTLPVVSKCIDDLRASYKITSNDLAPIATYPDADLRSIFKSNDYPQRALMDGQSGDVGTLFWVETDGRVSTCEVIEKSGVGDLDEKTCAIFKQRAKFRPALDSSGNSVRAPTFRRVRWRIVF